MIGPHRVNADPTVPSIRSSRLTRRRLLQAGAGAAALASGAASPSWATARGVPAIQGEPITLTYWHGWTEQWEEMVQFVVDQFHQQQSRIRIEPVVVPVGSQEQSSEFLAKLTAAIAAGEPPDIVTLFGSTAIPTLASQGALVPLDSLDGADLPTVEAWMDPNVYRLGRYEDHLYGLSYWAGAYALIYNKAHFAEVGLDPEVGPATVADLDAFAERLTVRSGSGDISRMGFLPSDLLLWGTVFGGNFYDPSSNEVTANDPNVVRALAWMRSYAEKYDAQKVAEFNEGLASERAANLDPLIAGKFSMQIQGPWKLGDIKKFGDPNFAYGVVRPPLADAEAQPANWTWGDIQVIPTGSKDPAAALEFVKFTAGVNDPDGYARRCTWGERPINVPVSRAVLEVPSFQQVVASHPGFDVFIDALLNGERIGSPPVMPAAAFFTDRLAAATDSVMLLQAEPGPALDDLDQSVQSELDRAR